MKLLKNSFRLDRI